MNKRGFLAGTRIMDEFGKMILPRTCFAENEHRGRHLSHTESSRVNIQHFAVVNHITVQSALFKERFLQLLLTHLHAFRHFGKLLLHLKDLIAVHKIVHEPAKRAVLIENGSRRGDGVMPGIEVHHAGIG